MGRDSYDDMVSPDRQRRGRGTNRITGLIVVFGILICGTGIGMSIAANKHRKVRAALCSETYSARFTRMHNDANVLCLGARVIGPGLAVDIADIFLATPFESGGRHEDRVRMITDIENGSL